jgi:hypothetical protein
VFLRNSGFFHRTTRRYIQKDKLLLTTATSSSTSRGCCSLHYCSAVTLLLKELKRRVENFTEISRSVVRVKSANLPDVSEDS